jgi:hypothetical protein
VRPVSGSGPHSSEDPRRLAELSALADGTLDPARRAEVEAWIDSSPELRQRLEEERRAAALLSAARERDRAPAALRERIESGAVSRWPWRAGSRDRTVSPSRVPAWRAPARRLAGATALLALVVLLALILPTGAPTAPSVSEAAALGARGPDAPPPGPQPSDPARLGLAVGGLYFPDWTHTISWRPIGRRQDSLDGRRVLTVYYGQAGRVVAYSIVAGEPLPLPGGSAGSAGRYAVRSLRLHGREVVTWREYGHTCLLSASGLPQRVLRALVAYA